MPVGLAGLGALGLDRQLAVTHGDLDVVGGVDAGQLRADLVDARPSSRPPAAAIWLSKKDRRPARLAMVGKPVKPLKSSESSGQQGTRLTLNGRLIHDSSRDLALSAVDHDARRNQNRRIVCGARGRTAGQQNSVYQLVSVCGTSSLSIALAHLTWRYVPGWRRWAGSSNRSFVAACVGLPPEQVLRVEPAVVDAIGHAPSHTHDAAVVDRDVESVAVGGPQAPSPTSGAAVHGIRRQVRRPDSRRSARASDHHVRIVPKGSAIRSLIT